MGIGMILELIAGATQVLTAFKGTAAMAKTTGYVQEAIGTIAALTPLVQQFGNGQEVTVEDARAALAGSHAAIKALEDAIASKPDAPRA